MTAPVNVAAPPAAPVALPGTGRPLRLTRLDRPGRVVGLGVLQVVGTQVCATAALLVYGFSLRAGAHGAQRWTWLTASILAGLLGVANLVRRDGRWLSEWLSLRLRWLVRRRRAAAAAEAAAGPSVAVGVVPAGVLPTDLATALPGLKVSGFVDRAARRHGLLFDGTEWTAVLGLTPVEQIVEFEGEAPRIPLDVLAASLHDRGVQLRTVQLVSVVVPARSGPEPAAAVVGVSRRRSYVSLTLDPALAKPAAQARGGGPEGSRRAVAVAASRLVGRLGEAGVGASVLDVDQVWLAVRTCLATLPAPPRADLQATPVAASPRPVDPDDVAQERWRGWYAPGTLHVGYRLTRWAAHGDPLSALEALYAVPALAVVTSLSVGTSRLGGHSLSIVVRIACRPWGEAAADQEVRRAAKLVGARVERLDGEHLAALAATLPLGGPR